MFAFILCMKVTGAACAKATLAKSAEKGKRWRPNELCSKRRGGDLAAGMPSLVSRHGGDEGARRGLKLPWHRRDRAVASAKGCSGPAGFVIPPALDIRGKISSAPPDLLYRGE